MIPQVYTWSWPTRITRSGPHTGPSFPMEDPSTEDLIHASPSVGILSKSELSIPSAGVPGFSGSLGTGDAFTPPSSSPVTSEENHQLQRYRGTTQASMNPRTHATALRHQLWQCSGQSQLITSKTKTAPNSRSSPHLVYQPRPQAHGTLHLPHLDHHLLGTTVPLPSEVRDT